MIQVKNVRDSQEHRAADPRGTADRIRVRSIGAVLSTLVVVFATEHQTQAQNAQDVRGVFPALSAPSPSMLAASEEDLRDLGQVEGIKTAENNAGKISSAGGSGGRRCEISPEEFAKFYPPLLEWIRTTLTVKAHAAQSVASLGFISHS